jgi:hypothetical protein
MHKGLTWFARIAGLVLTAFFLAFFIGEGIPNLIKSYGGQLSFFILFCIPSLAGFLIAWFRPYAGGIVMIIGALLLGSYFVFFADFRMAMVFGIPALLIGLSFLASVHKELV